MPWKVETERKAAFETKYVNYILRKAPGPWANFRDWCSEMGAQWKLHKNDLAQDGLFETVTLLPWVQCAVCCLEILQSYQARNATYLERGERKPALIMKTPAHSKLPACKTFNIEILQL
jgi:hypothetical protein